MDAARMVTPRRAASLALAALLGAGATLLVVTQPFTDEGGGGLRLLGSQAPDGPGHPAAPGQPAKPGHAIPPGWSHGNKNGWQGGSVPPGWAKHDKSGSPKHGPGEHDKSEHPDQQKDEQGDTQQDKQKDEHGGDGRAPKPGQGQPGH